MLITHEQRTLLTNFMGAIYATLPTAQHLPFESVTVAIAPAVRVSPVKVL